MDPNYGVDTLSVSLQSCEPFSATDFDFSKSLVASDIPRTDNLVGAFDSIIISESNGQRDDIGIDNVRFDDASETKFPETIRSSTRRSTCRSKCNQKNETQKAARKSRRIADKRALLDLLFLKVARRQRSGLCKRARSSAWGSLAHITEVFEQNEGIDVNHNEHKESPKARTVQRGRKSIKDRTSQSSQTSKGETQAFTRCICLKVKLGKGASPSSLLNMVSDTDNDLDKYKGVVITSPKLSSDIDGKLEEEVDSRSRSDSLNENQNKAAVLSEATIRDVRLQDKVINENSDGKSAYNLHGIPTQDGVGGLDENIEYRCLDPGTSPDSEVINVNPEAQSSGIVSEDLEDVLISCKDVAHGDLTSLSPSETSSEKGITKDKMYQANNSGGEGGLPGLEIINDAVLYDKYGQKEIIGDVSCNGVSISTTPGVASSYASSSEGCHIESLHSSPVTEVGGSAETSKVESGGEFELSLGGGLESPESRLSEKLLPDAAPMARKRTSKLKGMSKSKPEVSGSVNKRRTNCRQKGFEAKSIGECKIKEKNGHETVCEVQSCPETGIDEVDDVKDGCRSATGGLSNLALVPSGMGDHHGSPRNAWVCCDDCYKWRRIPAVLADSIEATNCRWICKDNTDKAFADCSIPQEKSNTDINTELEISDEEDNYDSRLNFNQIGQKQPTVPVQSPWKLIKSNLFLHRNRKNQSIDEIMVCHCKPPLDGRKGCRDGCLNRMLNIECAKGTCPCGELCSNQQFQKRKYAKLKCFRCGKKGYGLQSEEDIPKGRFLIEYVGEVLDMHAYEARQREYAVKGHKHFYFMTLNGSEVIDACAKGNLGRFINHSCEPNCRTEKWMVNGEVCIGLFAMRDIKKGEEVTFDYNYVRVFGAAAKKCVCASSQCRGYIGGDPLNAEVIVQGDSDDEYPEPVMLYEDGAAKLDNLIPGSRFFDGAETQSPESLLRKNVEMDKRPTAVGHLEITKEKKPPGTLLEDKADNDNSTTGVGRMEITPENEGLTEGSSSAALKSEHSLELEGSVGLLPMSIQPVATISQPIQHVAIPSQTNEGKSEITSEDPNGYSGGEEDEKRSLCTIERNETSSLSSTVSNLLPACVKVKKKSKSNTDETARLTSKSHPRTKASRPSSLVKRGKPKINSVNLAKPPEIENHSLSVPCKSKKLSQVPSDGRFEAVQQKLNELLDADGGISKRKDASRGYLKLLFLTAASGDSGNGEGIQSNRDLSMILDALLKTKSRTVLADIINKNGLQMLHNIMKRYRKEFIKIPILRKLLKVLEYLAVREILTLENINRGPPHPGVVSFRESILELTEHIDKQVHQIARNFRDRWIPRRKHNFMERDVDRMDLQRVSNFSRSSASRDHSSDLDGKHMEAIDNSFKQSPSSNTPPVDVGNVEGSSAPCASSCITNGTRTRKRKSRWDQPADSTSPTNKEPRCSLPWSHLSTQAENGEAVLDHVSSEAKNICQRGETDDLLDRRQNADEDAPPGFSSPLNRTLLQSNVSSIATESVMGHPQERFVSRMTISYGVPLSILQQLETPHAATAESWAIAPAMPFQPFPPLPLYPRERRGPPPALNSLTVNQPVEEQALHNPAIYHSDRNQNTPTTSGTNPQDVAVPGPNDQPSFQGGRGFSNSLGRKYFRQQKWKNSRGGPPWIQRNNGWGGFKGTTNSSNGMGSTGMVSGVNRPQGPYSSGMVSNGTLSGGTSFPQQPQH